MINARLTRSFYTVRIDLTPIRDDTGTFARLGSENGSFIKPGTGPFSIAVWIHTAEELDDVLGDVITWYNADARTGYTLSLMNYAGVTSAQSNWRNILFGQTAGRTRG